jgi:hypothetical protein
MKNFCKLLSLFMLVAAFGFVACKKSTAPVDDTTKVVLESDHITIDGNGGVYSIGYTIVNGISGIDIVAESDVQWMKNFRTQQSRILFDYDKNYTPTVREAQIAVRYPGLKSDSLFAEASHTLVGGFGPVVLYRTMGEWHELVCEPVDAKELILLLEQRQ